MFFIKKLTQPMDMNAPPKPQSTPEIRKETYPILFTLMPTDAAALAFSPTARSRKPSLVLVRKNQTAKIEMKARYVRTLCPESMGPISGILLISGSTTVGSVYALMAAEVVAFSPVSRYITKTVPPVAARFTAIHVR